MYQNCVLITASPYKLHGAGTWSPLFTPCPGAQSRVQYMASPQTFVDCWTNTIPEKWWNILPIGGKKLLCYFFLSGLQSTHNIRLGQRAHLSISASPFTHWPNHESYTETFPYRDEFSLSVHKLEAVDFNYQKCHHKWQSLKFLGSGEDKTQVGQARNTFTHLVVFWIISTETGRIPSRGFQTSSNYLKVWLAF